MAQINPYLSFNGTCREIMNFYNECLTGLFTVQTVSESPVAAQCPDAVQDHVMHSSVSKNGQLLIMGSDMHRNQLVDGNTTTLCIGCESAEEINTFFEKLARDGQVIDPLQTAFWGDTFGVLADKFGRQWMLVYHRREQ